MYPAVMTMAFTTAKRNVDPIPFTLDGEEFSFIPPKQAGMILPFLDSGVVNDLAEMQAAFDWLGEGLPEEQANRIIARLRDKSDDFDLDMLRKVLDYLMEQVNGRPTG